MKRKDLLWALALLAICCLSARSVIAQEEEDESKKYEIRAYRVADLLMPAPNYPYRGGLPTAGSLDPLGRMVGGGMGGLGGGFSAPPTGAQSGGGFGGGMFSVRAGATQAAPQMGTGGQGQPGALGGFGGGGSAIRRPLGRDIDELIDTIMSTVDPESWDDVGGPGSIACFGGLLLIRQLPETHARIDDLLDTIRSEGDTAQTAVVDAHWLPLDADQLAQLLGADSAKSGGRAPLAVDPGALAKLAREVPGYRGRITCFSGQTVHLASGSRRSVVIGAIPVVGSAPAYQPIMATPNLGVVLEVTPALGSEDAVVDLHSMVTEWREPDPPVRIGSPYASTRRIPMVPGEVEETPGGTASMEVDRLNIPAQQMSTTLRVPLGKPVLVGGLTLEPTETASGEQTDRQRKQLYLVVRVSAAADDGSDEVE